MLDPISAARYKHDRTLVRVCFVYEHIQMTEEVSVFLSIQLSQAHSHRALQVIPLCPLKPPMHLML